MEKAYAAWRAFQDRLLAPAGAVLFVGATLLALLEVARRYVFGLSFEWQQDAVTYFILSGVFLYFSISQRRGAHLTVTLVPDMLNVFGGRCAVAGEVMKACALAFSCAFIAAVVWWGIPEVEDSIRYETRTESLGFPLWPFLATLLFSFACMAITMLFQIYRAVQALRGRTVLEEPGAEADGTH